MGYLEYVNIRQGTKSVPRFSAGNTLPMVQMPFGMGGYALQTASDRGNWFFHPEDHCVEGIRLTHQPSPWVGDYGCICFLPETGGVHADVDTRWSGYRPKEAVIRPDYMKLTLLRYRTVVELAPTERGAVMRLQYPDDGQPRFAILPVYGNCHFAVADAHTVIGYTDAQMRNDARQFKMHVVFLFDCEIDLPRCHITRQNGEHRPGTVTQDGFDGLNIALKQRAVTVKTASSYISAQQAQRNLERETGTLDFAGACAASQAAWEAKLSKIEVETETEAQKKTFYSCLARMFLYPHKSFELDEADRPIHYCPHSGGVAAGVSYTNNGFWDTFRTVYPFLSIVSPEDYREILEGFVNIYRDCGWLPRWPAIGEFGCMPGTLIDAVIADAAVKGIADGKLLEDAFEGMCKHANRKAEDPRYGRVGVEEYNRYGYVPNHIEESVNNSLDSYYGDFCIAQVAGVLGREELRQVYLRRSQNYRLLFDAKTGLMRGLDAAGRPGEDFDPFAWGGEYTEGSAWQSSFAVQQDFDGLAALHGGPDAFLKKLDEVFAVPPDYRTGGYGREIHEMTEMAAVDFGQCAISNQPSFHYPYLYAYFGAQDKTDYWVQKIADELFSWRDDGFPGDEDNGTMAGWYVFSSLGLYPLCPGKPEYVKGKMLVKSVKINGRRFDGRAFAGSVIPHSWVMEQLR